MSEAHGPKSRLAIEHCSGGEEAHMAHLRINEECPWCGAFLDTLATRLDLTPWTLEADCWCKPCRDARRRAEVAAQKEGKS